MTKSIANVGEWDNGMRIIEYDDGTCDVQYDASVYSKEEIEERIRKWNETHDSKISRSSTN